MFGFVPAVQAQGPDAIVQGVLSDCRSSWHTTPFGDRIIVTDCTLDVTRTIRGSVPPVLAIRVDGGTVDGVTLEVSKQPKIVNRQAGTFPLKRQLDGTYRWWPERRS